MATVAANLRKFREAAGLTQAEAGEKMGRDANSIARWERGDVWITVGELKILVTEVYKASMDSVFKKRQTG